ncbi:MAG: hypothetical protein OFPII_09180 [Osedax symbiont Rs1]|nr:MAG: hypothetical protein OFPII_09180 [Osedax symbiont Rs1]
MTSAGCAVKKSKFHSKSHKTYPKSAATCKKMALMDKLY